MLRSGCEVNWCELREFGVHPATACSQRVASAWVHNLLRWDQTGDYPHLGRCSVFIDIVVGQSPKWRYTLPPGSRGEKLCRGFYRTHFLVLNCNRWRAPTLPKKRSTRQPRRAQTARARQRAVTAASASAGSRPADHPSYPRPSWSRSCRRGRGCRRPERRWRCTTRRSRDR